MRGSSCEIARAAFFHARDYINVEKFIPHFPIRNQCSCTFHCSRPREFLRLLNIVSHHDGRDILLANIEICAIDMCDKFIPHFSKDSQFQKLIKRSSTHFPNYITFSGKFAFLSETVIRAFSLLSSELKCRKKFYRLAFDANRHFQTEAPGSQSWHCRGNNRGTVKLSEPVETLIAAFLQPESSNAARVSKPSQCSCEKWRGKETLGSFLD